MVGEHVLWRRWFRPVVDATVEYFVQRFLLGRICEYRFDEFLEGHFNLFSSLLVLVMNRFERALLIASFVTWSERL